MLRLSACTADCVLGCGLIETAHIHNSSSRGSSPPSSAVSRADAAGCARNEPPPPFRVVIWARTRAHCAQWDFKSGLYSLFLVCSSQSVHLHSAYLVLPRNLYLLLESIYTHKYRAAEAATRPKSFPLAPAALGFPFGARLIIAGQSHWGVFSFELERERVSCVWAQPEMIMANAN